VHRMAALAQPRRGVFSGRCFGTWIAVPSNMKRFSFRQMAVVGICAFVLMWSSMSLQAEPELVDLCCGGPGDCGAGDRCCPPEILGLSDCSDTDLGYCRTSCVRPGRPGGVQ